MTDTSHLADADLNDCELIEALCIALREVGVCNTQLPDGPDVRNAIARTRTLETLTRRRGLRIANRLEKLSAECQWDMVRLCADCLAFPQILPYLNSTPPPKCGNCGERIPFSATLRLCRKCVDAGIRAIGVGKPSHLNQCSVCARTGPGFLVYADGADWMHYCENCLAEARQRYKST